MASNSTNALTFTRHDLQDGRRQWTLVGSKGGVSWWLLGGYAGAIDVHSPVPEHDGEEPTSEDCDVIGGVCYSDGGALEGEKLARRWREAGEDDAVIRTELESWYAREFGGEQR